MAKIEVVTLIALKQWHMSAIANLQREFWTGSNYLQRFGNAVARKSFSVNETNEFAEILDFYFFHLETERIRICWQNVIALLWMRLPNAIANRSRNRIPSVNDFFFFFLRSTQGGGNTVYGLTEMQDSSVGLHVEKNRHDYRLKHPQGRQDQKQHE